MWQCGSALYHARELSNGAIREFHQNLNREQYEQIYLAADQSFASTEKHDELVRFLEGVHRRFGDARTENLINVNVNATTRGTFIVAQYNTTFVQGSATEGGWPGLSRSVRRPGMFNDQSRAPSLG